MNTNQQIIEEFYAGFAAAQPETMASCYHPDVVFEDPAFGKLHGKDAADMWRMLLQRAQGNLKIEFDSVQANEHNGSARWVATYLFSATGRLVVNRIQARFVFKDGLIVGHHDYFDVYRWSRQAFGLTGTLLGWTPLFKAKIRKKALESLRKWQASQN